MIGAKLWAIRRERMKLSLEKAAQLLGWAPAKFSRIENGIRHVSSEEVATIVTAYGLAPRERAEIIADARMDNPSCVWDCPLPGVPLDAVSASYFDEAYALTDWSVSLVPRLLRTEAYALAVMRSDGLEDAAQRWQASEKQQARLGTVDYTAYIGEAVLYRAFGGPAAHREQLAHLYGLRVRGIGLRIVPDRVPVGLVSHSWLRMAFPSTPPVVVIAALGSSAYLHNDQAMRYDRQLTLLDEIALPTAQSRDMVGAAMRGADTAGIRGLLAQRTG
jgi:transcriptional regulator with XRE-family HTH domain